MAETTGVGLKAARGGEITSDSADIKDELQSWAVSTEAAVKIQSLYRSHRSRALQRNALHRQLLIDAAIAAGRHGTGQVLSYMWPRNLRTPMCLAIAAATDIAEVLHPDAAHAVQAVEALHAMYELQCASAGAEHSESRAMRQSTCLAYNAFAAHRIALNATKHVGLALQRGEALSKEGLFSSRLAQIELRAWNVSLQSEAAAAAGENQKATELAAQSIELEALLCSPLNPAAGDSTLSANLALSRSMYMTLHVHDQEGITQALREADQAACNCEGVCVLTTDLMPAAQFWIPKACIQAVVRHNCAVAAIQHANWPQAVELSAGAMQHAVTAVGMLSRWGATSQHRSGSGLCTELAPRFEQLFKLAIHAAATGECNVLVRVPAECRVESNRAEGELAHARTSLHTRDVQPELNLLPLWWLMCSSTNVTNVQCLQPESP